MADCHHSGCDGDGGLAYTCNFCGGRFCADHRLPEKHFCIPKKPTQDSSPDFREANKSDDTDSKRRSHPAEAARDTGNEPPRRHRSTDYSEAEKDTDSDNDDDTDDPTATDDADDTGDEPTPDITETADTDAHDEPASDDDAGDTGDSEDSNRSESSTSPQRDTSSSTPRPSRRDPPTSRSPPVKTKSEPAADGGPPPATQTRNGLARLGSQVANWVRRLWDSIWRTVGVALTLTKYALLLAVVALAAVGALSVFAPGVVDGFNQGGPTVSDIDVGGVETPIGDNSTATPTPAPSETQQGHNLAETEELFIGLLNDERQQRGLHPVSQRDVLTDMGRAHSDNMAENDYIGHEEPGGSTIEDRYRERGLLPECRLPIEGTDRYYAGAENANGLVIGNYRTTYGETLTVNTEEDIAQVLFREWMHSSGHRDAMLVASADEVGLGLSISDEGKVYASLELC